MIDPLYVAARGVLLDALEALGEQREALILAGAQAIYIHSGAADLAVAEFTTDGDLVVNPEQLKTQPRLSEAMERAQFRSGVQPGSWLRDRTVSGIATTIPVDLLVPEAVAGPGRRAARLGDHGDRAGRRVRGLEGALIDHSVMRLNALDEDDRREFQVRVAGPSALLVAKVHKLADRSGQGDAKRLKDKDALDVLRLLRAIPVERLAHDLRELGDSTLAGEVTREAIEHLHALFGATSSPGTVMVVRATERLEDPSVMAESCVVLANDLIQTLRYRSPRTLKDQHHAETADMTLPTDDDLRRLRHPAEDALVERKTAADSRDWVKTIVAFANSVPVDRYGLLYIGVRDDGTVERSQNLDSLQRTLRDKMRAVYPPILYSTRVLSDNNGAFLCVIIPGSLERPHFSGPSFVRVGSETLEASAAQFDRLIAERASKTYRILRHRGQTVSIASIRTDARSVQLLGRESGITREEIVDCSSSSVTLRGTGGTTRAIALGRVDIVEDAVSGNVTLEVQDR